MIKHDKMVLTRKQRKAHAIRARARAAWRPRYSKDLVPLMGQRRFAAKHKLPLSFGDKQPVHYRKLDPNMEGGRLQLDVYYKICCNTRLISWSIGRWVDATFVIPLALNRDITVNRYKLLRTKHDYYDDKSMAKTYIVDLGQFLPRNYLEMWAAWAVKISRIMTPWFGGGGSCVEFRLAEVHRGF